MYRKSTHTDQYLNFESNQPLDHKLSVVRALHHRADNVVSDPEDVRQEKKNYMHVATQHERYIRHCSLDAQERAVKPHPREPL